MGLLLPVVRLPPLELLDGDGDVRREMEKLEDFLGELLFFLAGPFGSVLPSLLRELRLRSVGLLK